MILVSNLGMPYTIYNNNKYPRVGTYKNIGTNYSTHQKGDSGTYKTFVGTIPDQ
jgi:hypothetical protein